MCGAHRGPTRGPRERDPPCTRVGNGRHPRTCPYNSTSLMSTRHPPVRFSWCSPLQSPPALRTALTCLHVCASTPHLLLRSAPLSSVSAPFKAFRFQVLPGLDNQPTSVTVDYTDLIIRRESSDDLTNYYLDRMRRGSLYSSNPGPADLTNYIYCLNSTYFYIWKIFKRY